MRSFMSTLLTIVLCFTSVFAPTVNINDNRAISAAQKGIASRLIRYYSPDYLGTIPERTSKGPDGFQWFEMGFYWMAMFDYSDVGNDIRYVETISGALANASFGRTASFLGGSGLAAYSAGIGKWNDDILWWALAAVHGAEIMGVNYQTPLKSTLFDIAKNTYVEVRDQWDELCEGGLYWARNRNDAQANKRTYKSTITNVEQIILAVRLYNLTNDKAYLDHAIKVYDWLVGPSKIVTNDGKVYDGLNSSDCVLVTREHSYNAGLYLGGAALLLKATNDQRYMQDIRRVIANFENVFVKDNIFIDPCEVTEEVCARNQAQFKGVAIFSLNYVYKYTLDSEIKNKLKLWIETSGAEMFKTCNDAWECSNFWHPDSNGLRKRQISNRPIDVHNQMNALFMSNSLSSIRSATVEGGRKKPNPSSDGYMINPLGAFTSVFALICLL